MKELTDPAFFTALATLLTAIGAVVKLFQVSAKTERNGKTIDEVHVLTNSRLTEMQARLESLQHALGQAGVNSTPTVPPTPTPPQAPAAP